MQPNTSTRLVYNVIFGRRHRVRRINRRTTC